MEHIATTVAAKGLAINFWHVVCGLFVLPLSGSVVTIHGLVIPLGEFLLVVLFDFFVGDVKDVLNVADKELEISKFLDDRSSSDRSRDGQGLVVDSVLF